MICGSTLPTDNQKGIMRHQSIGRFRTGLPASGAASMRSRAFSRCSPLAYAASMALMVMTLGCSFLRMESKSARAKSHRPVRPHELMAALKVMTSGETLALGMASNIAIAWWCCRPLSQQLMVLLKVMTSGRTAVSRIASNKPIACCQRPPFSHELIPALKLIVSPEGVDALLKNNQCSGMSFKKIQENQLTTLGLECYSA